MCQTGSLAKGPSRVRVFSWVVMGLVCLAGTAEGTAFPCSKAGLDAAIAAAEGGDSGPHSLSCTPGDVVDIVDTLRIAFDLTLDCGGVMIECENCRRGFIQFELTSTPTCVRRVTATATATVSRTVAAAVIT